MKNLSKSFRFVNDNGDEIIFDYSHGFLINKPVGIDTVAVTMNESQGINQVGSTVQSANVQSRPVNISGILVGDFQAENKSKLLSVIRPDISGKFYADDYYLSVRVTVTPTVEAKNNFAKFEFSMLAPYPYWQRDQSATVALSGVRKLFKFPWNISRPYRFGEDVKQKFININNNGQIPVPFVVTFTASAEIVNPRIVDAATNKQLAINKTLIPGERLVVEITHERTNVFSSIDGECRGALDIFSNLNRLAVGDNVLKPEADSDTYGLTIDVNFATELVGIVV